MEIEELKKLFDFLYPSSFIFPIDLEEQKKYDLAFDELRKKVSIKNTFFIQKDIFIKIILNAYENEAKALKIHFIKEADDLDINIGFSFTKFISNEDGSIDNDLDLCYVGHNNQLLKISKKDFSLFKLQFAATTLKEINQYTNKSNTQFIRYDMEDVIRYIVKNLLSNTFTIKGILINQFIFKDYEHVNPNMNDRIGLSIHSILDDTLALKETKSIGYDFGTVYP